MQTALEDAAALGVTVTVAAGDGGSSDGESDGEPHVDFPASSPFALGCGGTRLTASGATIASEVVWNETSAGEGATGGGVSVVFPLPVWQQHSQVPQAPNGSAGRGVPDVAGNADPLTGYQVLVDGQPQVIGGTSAVAPLWAALIARCNQQLGRPLGDVHAALYQIGERAFRDITRATTAPTAPARDGMPARDSARRTGQRCSAHWVRSRSRDACGCAPAPNPATRAATPGPRCRRHRHRRCPGLLPASQPPGWPCR